MKTNSPTYIKNRNAHYKYFYNNGDTYKAGIVLKGSEVKSIRAGHCNISEAYCYFNNGELFLRNAQISSLNHLMFSHIEICDRKLLLTRKELRKLQKQSSVKGYTIIPTCIIIPVGGYIKVQIALCKGKHDYDKRNTIKERDLERYGR